MKKGVVILGSLILGLAFCVPAVAQPSSKAVETIVIDNFDTDMEWSWAVQSSRFIAEGYPILKKFEGIPNSLIPYQKDSDPAAMVLGVKAKYDRKGDNWFEIFPVSNETGEAMEIPLLGQVSQIDLWAWGANYNYYLELLVRDADSVVHVIPAATLNYEGWKNIVVQIPTAIRQQSRLRSGPENLTFVGFRIRSAASEYVDDFVIYLDQFRYTTNTMNFVYDGFELRKPSFESNTTSEGASSAK